MDTKKYIRNGKEIQTTERLYNMIYKNIGYKTLEDTKLEKEVLGDIEDYNELTVAELQDKAETLKLEDYKGLKKAELIDLIKGE